MSKTHTTELLTDDQHTIERGNSIVRPGETKGDGTKSTMIDVEGQHETSAKSADLGLLKYGLN